MAFATPRAHPNQPTPTHPPNSPCAPRERARRSTVTQAGDPFTLVVALDPTSGAATGDLYLDDGRSYAFAAGHYLHRRWVWGEGRGT
jgi:alpha 1,3-glucosidase